MAWTFGGVVFAVLGPGCVNSGGADAPSPLSPSWDEPVSVRVQVDKGSEEVLDLPKGALTSEVALVDANSGQVCFDVKIRTWQGAVPRWDFTLDVDGAVIEQRAVELAACTSGSAEPWEVPPRLSCLPVDTTVATFVTDSLEAVKVRGARVCFAHHGKLRGESSQVALQAVQGAASMQFRWNLDAKHGGGEGHAAP